MVCKHHLTEVAHETHAVYLFQELQDSPASSKALQFFIRSIAEQVTGLCKVYQNQPEESEELAKKNEEG